MINKKTKKRRENHITICLNINDKIERHIKVKGDNKVKESLTRRHPHMQARIKRYMITHNNREIDIERTYEENQIKDGGRLKIRSRAKEM